MDYAKSAEKLLLNLYKISSLPDQKQLMNLSKGELCVLFALTRYGDLKPGELMKITETSSAHMAKILRNLQAKKEVIRSADLSDRRSYVMSITEKGRKHVAEVYGHAVTKTISVMKKLEEEDIEDLLRITDRLLSMKEEVVSE